MLLKETAAIVPLEKKKDFSVGCTGRSSRGTCRIVGNQTRQVSRIFTWVNNDWQLLCSAITQRVTTSPLGARYNIPGEDHLGQWSSHWSPHPAGRYRHQNSPQWPHKPSWWAVIILIIPVGRTLRWTLFSVMMTTSAGTSIITPGNHDDNDGGGHHGSRPAPQHSVDANAPLLASTFFIFSNMVRPRQPQPQPWRLTTNNYSNFLPALAFQDDNDNPTPRIIDVKYRSLTTHGCSLIWWIIKSLFPWCVWFDLKMSDEYVSWTLCLCGPTFCLSDSESPVNRPDTENYVWYMASVCCVWALGLSGPHSPVLGHFAAPC